jgi:hypothetical protein
VREDSEAQQCLKYTSLGGRADLHDQAWEQQQVRMLVAEAATQLRPSWGPRHQRALPVKGLHGMAS